MINYALKSEVMRLGLPNELRKISKAKYALKVLNETGEVLNCGRYTTNPVNALIDEQFYYKTYGFEKCHEAEKINYSQYKRVKRLKDKIAFMLNKGKCIFLTFTFTDEVFSKTNENTRRQKVRRFLSSYNCDYVANKDYGAKKGREHYHALIQTDKVNYADYNYGALNGQIVASISDNIKLAKYIAKLTNHAIKETCKGSRIIYNK